MWAMQIWSRQDNTSPPSGVQKRSIKVLDSTLVPFLLSARETSKKGDAMFPA